jgi:hypothetical protein
MAGNQQAGMVNGGGAYGDHACMWTGTPGSFVDLHPGSPGYSWCYGTTGTYQFGASNDIQHACIWYDTPGSWVDLTPPGATDARLRAGTPTRQGGRCNPGVQAYHACIWTGTPESVVDLHPPGAFRSEVRGMADDQEAGWVEWTQWGGSRAAIWHGTSSSMVELHPPGAQESGAEATTGEYQAGYLTLQGPPNGRHAAVWHGTAESVEDLHLVLPPNYAAHSMAFDICEANGVLYVAGWAGDDEYGWGLAWGEAILWMKSLTPPCTADINGDATVNVLDLLLVLAAWDQTGVPEDINGDGVVDVLDLLEILAQWGPCPIPETGACCIPPMQECQDLTLAHCQALAGQWFEDEQCATFTCPPPPIGACCIPPAQECQDLIFMDCEALGGQWFQGQQCATFNCPAPSGETIESAIPVPSLPYSTDGDTSTFDNDYDEACPYGSLSGDVVYAYAPSAGGTIDITLCADSQYDTKLFVYESAHTPGAPYACNEDACVTPAGQPFVSRLLGLSVSSGSTYYIVIDGYNGQSGYYTLDID